MAVRVKAMAPDLAVELAANLEYLAKYGRDAALPEIRSIQRSKFGADCVEVRTSLEPNNENAAHLRTIAYFVADGENIFLALCGDKRGTWSEWYGDAVPLADAIYAGWLEHQQA